MQPWFSFSKHILKKGKIKQLRIHLKILSELLELKRNRWESQKWIHSFPSCTRIKIISLFFTVAMHLQEKMLFLFSLLMSALLSYSNILKRCELFPEAPPRHPGGLRAEHRAGSGLGQHSPARGCHCETQSAPQWWKAWGSSEPPAAGQAEWGCRDNCEKNKLNRIKASECPFT